MIVKVAGAIAEPDACFKINSCRSDQCGGPTPRARLVGPLGHQMYHWFYWSCLMLVAAWMIFSLYELLQTG